MPSTEYHEGRYQGTEFFERYGAEQADEVVDWLESYESAEPGSYYKSAYFAGFRFSVNEAILNSLS